MTAGPRSLADLARRHWLWALTFAALLGLLLWVPGDRCTAASSGACVLPDDPLPQRASVGDPAGLRLGTVTVDKAQAGTRLKTARQQVTTQGRFVLVAFTVETSDKPRALRATLRSGERTYTSVLDSLVPTGGLLGPGLPGSVQKVFELPLDAADADLLIMSDLGTAGDVALVDLGRVGGQGTLRVQEETND